MDYKLPQHIIKQYGAPRGFREYKRRLVREMLRLNRDLYCGSAYLPDGDDDRIQKIERELTALADDLSVKNWGR